MNTTLNQKPGPSGSGGSALLQQLTGSLFVIELERQLNEAGNTRDLEVVAKAMDRPAFDALPADARLELATLYAARLFGITGALLG